jgi:hypothetical protein
MHATQDPDAGVDGSVGSSQATLDVQLKPVSQRGAWERLARAWDEALGGIPHDVQPRELTEAIRTARARRQTGDCIRNVTGVTLLPAPPQKPGGAGRT